jgi:hypothetical protein
MHHGRRAFLDFLCSFVTFLALAGAAMVAAYQFVFGVGGGYVTREAIVRTVVYLVDPAKGGVLFLTLLAIGLAAWVMRPVPRARPRV